MGEPLSPGALPVTDAAVEGASMLSRRQSSRTSRTRKVKVAKVLYA